MKVSLAHHGQVHSVEVDHDDLTLGSVIDMLEALLIGAGFDAGLVREAFQSAPLPEPQKHIAVIE